MSKRDKRKAMRSGTMECPICGEHKRLVEHHINGRDIPDWNRPYNVVGVCPNCHDEIHAGDVIIEGWVYTTSGKELSFYRRGDDKPNLAEDSEVYTY